MKTLVNLLTFNMLNMVGVCISFIAVNLELLVLTLDHVDRLRFIS